MERVPGDLLRTHLQTGRDVVLVAPYMKVSALRRLLSFMECKQRVQCITRWRHEELLSGVSDIECREVVVSEGGSFLLHPTVHAKYYRVDDVVLIGSANVTNAGLGWTDNANVEILWRAGTGFQAEEFEKQLVDVAREMGEAEVDRWRIILEADRKRWKQAMPPQEWRPETRELRHVELAYRGQIGEVASEDEQRAALRDIEAMELPDGLTTRELRAWAGTRLLTASFSNSVLRLQDEDRMEAARRLAKAYGVDGLVARRAMETVENWIAALMPEMLNRTR